MSKSSKLPIPADARQLQRSMTGVRRVMWLKRGIPLGLLAVWMLTVLLCIAVQKSPEAWLNEKVSYARIEQRQVKSWSRFGSRTKQVDVLVAEDGREFRIREGAEIQAKLSTGEACRIVYEPSLSQTLHIRALSTAEDGELMPLADSITAQERLIQGLWWMLAIGAGLCLTALGLVEAFGLRPERLALARLQQVPVSGDRKARKDQ